MGKDSPPSALYNPEAIKIRKAEPLFSIGKSPRFHQPQ